MAIPADTEPPGELTAHTSTRQRGRGVGEKRRQSGSEHSCMGRRQMTDINNRSANTAGRGTVHAQVPTPETCSRLLPARRRLHMLYMHWPPPSALGFGRLRRSRWPCGRLPAQAAGAMSGGCAYGSRRAYGRYADVARWAGHSLYIVMSLPGSSLARKSICATRLLATSSLTSVPRSRILSLARRE